MCLSFTEHRRGTDMAFQEMFIKDRERADTERKGDIQTHKRSWALRSMAPKGDYGPPVSRPQGHWALYG